MTTSEMTFWGVLAGMVWAAGYFVACAFWPFANCRRCGGGGRKRSPSKKFWRPCRRCKGTGRRVRTGRRVFNFLAGQKDRAA